MRILSVRLATIAFALFAAILLALTPAAVEFVAKAEAQPTQQTAAPPGIEHAGGETYAPNAPPETAEERRKREEELVKIGVKAANVASSFLPPPFNYLASCLVSGFAGWWAGRRSQR